MTIVLLLVAALAGAAAACQGAANAALAARAGLGMTLLVNTGLVLAGVLILCLVTGAWRTGGAVLGAPPASYIGGLCGLFIIATLTFVFPRVGPGLAVALMVLGQGVAALLIEHHGLWGVPVTSVTPSRLVGAALLVAGVLLMRR
jgi:transporter family-2 protein